MPDTLMVIDAQSYWAEGNPETTQKIKNNLDAARRQGLQVLWVYAQENPNEKTSFLPLPPQLVGSKNVKELFNGHASFLFDPTIPPKAGDWVIGKGPNQTDAFTNPHLEPFLKQQQGKVYVAGFMTGFCTYDTAVSAKNARLPMTLLSDLSADKNDQVDSEGGSFAAAKIPEMNSQDLLGGLAP